MEKAIVALLFAGLLLALAACHRRINKIAGLIERRGEVVEVEGVVAREAHQHPVDPPDTHPKIHYVDLLDGQLVVYTRESLGCPKGDTVELKGRVREIELPFKGQERARPQGTLREYHLVVDTWRCR